MDVGRDNDLEQILFELVVRDNEDVVRDRVGRGGGLRRRRPRTRLRSAHPPRMRTSPSRRPTPFPRTDPTTGACNREQRSKRPCPRRSRTSRSSRTTPHFWAERLLRSRTSSSSPRSAWTGRECATVPMRGTRFVARRRVSSGLRSDR